MAGAGVLSEIFCEPPPVISEEWTVLFGRDRRIDSHGNPR